jgi:hypothetical protein
MRLNLMMSRTELLLKVCAVFGLYFFDRFSMPSRDRVDVIASSGPNAVSSGPRALSSNDVQNEAYLLISVDCVVCR